MGALPSSLTEMQTPIRILLAEDVATEAELDLRELKRAGLRVNHRIVETEADFRRELAEFEPEVILSDFSMPRFDGMAALLIARELCPDTPFIFVSGTIGEEYAIRALKNGAMDYVLKTNLVRLPAAVERALQDARSAAARRRAEVELVATRETLASIFESLEDVLWAIAVPEETIRYVSPAVRRVYGCAPEDFAQDPGLWHRMIHPDDRDRVDAAWVAMLAGDQFDVEHRIMHTDGMTRWINVRARLVTDAQGKAVRVDGVARDISDKIEQRQRIERLSRIRNVSSNINSALVRIREREELFEEVCRITADVGGFHASRVGVVVPTSPEVRWVASRGIDTITNDKLGASTDESAPFGNGIVGRSLRSGEPVIANDTMLETDLVHRDTLLGIGTRACVSLPLMVERESIGVLVLHATEAGFFDQEEVQLLSELAGNISFALEMIAKREKLNYLAYYDPLTGLPNRSLFEDRLTRAIEAASRAGEKLAVLMFDIERFRAINDTFGRHIGDRLLQLLAARLKAGASDGSGVARLGGDHFAVVFPSIRSETDVVRELGERVSAVFELPFDLDGRELRIAAKAGIAVFPNDGGDVDALFRNAEATLKKAKASGERYLFYAPQINARVAEQLLTENKLRKALEQKQFVLHFQPKVDLTSRKVQGLEALIRWNDPETGLVPPVRFIPVLEETGLILGVGQWVIEEAIATYRDWRRRGLSTPRIAVNVSALQLREKDFAEKVRDALSGEAPEDCRLDLEITESLLMQDIAGSIQKLDAVRKLGVRISLDDFGTGHSSLGYLSRLPIDTLKIDRSFVVGMTENADDTSIVSSIISLAQALRLSVVAEGVETEPQAQLLRLLRCDQMQGYLFSKPLPRAELEAFLALQ
jgi:diguanylate cyclase (GGDEF)-like protein/PAS domain S-box-containing protein